MGHFSSGLVPDRTAQPLETHWRSQFRTHALSGIPIAASYSISLTSRVAGRTQRGPIEAEITSPRQSPAAPASLQI